MILTGYITKDGFISLDTFLDEGRVATDDDRPVYEDETRQRPRLTVVDNDTKGTA